LLVKGDIDKMDSNTANDEQQISTVSAAAAVVDVTRPPLVGKRSTRLLLALNSLLVIVIGLGFLFNTETIFPHTSIEAPKAQSIEPSSTLKNADEKNGGIEPAIVATDQSDISFPVRVLDFVQFFVLILIGVICGLISLGCLALISDRPFGDFITGIIGISACLWLSALALFVPSPERFLLDPIQYSVAGLILWLSSSWLLGLGARIGLSFTGGTVAALGIMALGSRVVVWATWS
jgi:hypothetical protein